MHLLEVFLKLAKENETRIRVLKEQLDSERDSVEDIMAYARRNGALVQMRCRLTHRQDRQTQNYMKIVSESAYEETMYCFNLDFFRMLVE